MNNLCAQVADARRLRLDVNLLVKVRFDKLAIEPADLVESGPQLRRLVDIDLGRLLRVGFAELLADLSPPDLLDEDPSLGAQVDRWREVKDGSEFRLSRVEQVEMRFAVNRPRIAPPAGLETR
jgi:hypothetical protein